jgi:hypothetical protein
MDVRFCLGSSKRKTAMGRLLPFVTDSNRPKTDDYDWIFTPPQ